MELEIIKKSLKDNRIIIETLAETEHNMKKRTSYLEGVLLELEKEKLRGEFDGISEPTTLF